MAWLGRFDDFNGINIGSNESAKKFSKMQTTRTHSALAKHSRPVNNQTTANVSSENGQPGYYRIEDITVKMHTVAVIGVIIVKDAPKAIISKKGNGSERHLLALTVCDAPLSFINVTCWGSGEFVNFLASEINIGDVVDIKGAHVQPKSNNSSDEKFKPWTSSPCHLVLSDNQGSIVPYGGFDASEYTYLLHVPTRPSNDFYTLEDVQANGMNLQGEHINILAALKKIWPVREITTKFGKKTKKVDIVVCDENCPSFHLTLWDNFVHLAESWIPFETADVKITFSEFHSSMVASTSSKTILTIDPDTVEAHSLQQFVVNQSLLMSSENLFSDTKDPDIESITNVLTVREAKTLQRDVSSTGQPGYAVVYAFLSHFDIDADMKIVLKEVCCRCRRRVYESSGFVCANPDCVAGEQVHGDITDVEYSVTASLSDHTGSLMYCGLSQNVVEKIMECKAKDFKHLTEEEKTRIKWSYLLERVKAVLKIKPADDRPNGRGYIRILALEKASTEELLKQCFSSC